MKSHWGRRRTRLHILENRKEKAIFLFVLHYLLLPHVKRLLINEADQEATFPSAEEAQQKLALTGEV